MGYNRNKIMEDFFVNYIMLSMVSHPFMYSYHGVGCGEKENGETGEYEIVFWYNGGEVDVKDIKKLIMDIQEKINYKELNETIKALI
jgi:hypothetical protein